MLGCMSASTAPEPVHFQLGEVFNEAGLPDVTYVPPAESRQLRGSLATSGKHVTLVGPSGSGKSTVATRALDSLNLTGDDVFALTGRSHVGASTILEVLGKEFGVAPELEAVSE